MHRKGISIAVASCLAACSAASPAPGGGSAAASRVTGTVTYRERVALSPTAVVQVRFVDVSRADAPAVVLAEQVIRAEGRQVPIPFELEYDPTRIEANHAYAVQARIEDGGTLLFVSDQRHPVVTRGAATHVDMLLRSVSGAVPR